MIYSSLHLSFFLGKKESEQPDSNRWPPDIRVMVIPLQSGALPTELCSEGYFPKNNFHF